jgi:hypothetical protein
MESMVALMALHPGVYVDVAALQSPNVLPRAAYYRYLQLLVDAGFGKRIMFGSDLPDQVSAGIDALQQAPFLTAEQQSDVLCSKRRTVPAAGPVAVPAVSAVPGSYFFPAFCLAHRARCAAAIFSRASADIFLRRRF